jgi:sterol desaturase/sphingolipid hydroxylase (fatty acid hydroxylase superfamily)
MPTPLDILLNPVALTCIGIYAMLMLWEYLQPARRLPVVPYWQLRGLVAFVLYVLVSSYLPMLWDATLAQYRLQALFGLLTYELALYWWHRTMHDTDWLWRSFHQLHHSAERLDTYGAFWFSPLDMVGFTFVGSFALVVVAGVGAEAAMLVLYATFFLTVFQHTNIRTPTWLGYVIQRPESHALHHGRGVHRYNYADLPVFDMLFGTFRNPAEHCITGFYHGASKRIGDMLLWRDLNPPPYRKPLHTVVNTINS